MRYGKIESRIWNDEKFIRLTPMQQRLFLYCLTCPHGNLIGLFVLKKEYIIGDLKSLPKDLDKDLVKLCESGLLSYDFKHSVIFIKNFLKHNPITNPNQRKAARSILSELPKSPLINDFLVLHKGLGEGLPEGLREVLSKPDSDSDTDTDSETECGTASGRTAKRRCAIPENMELTEELAAYAKAKGINGNVQEVFGQFKDHHKAKGTLGIDWDAAWRNWVRNEIKFAKNRYQPPNIEDERRRAQELALGGSD